MVTNEKAAVPAPTGLVGLSLREVGDLLEAKEISARELLDATLAQISRTEPTVAAYVNVLEDAAREAAAEVDRDAAKGIRRGPLHGIPVAVKDLCDMAGEPTEAGSRALVGNVADTDSAVVARLRRAGANIIGKTVTHEFAVGVNTPPTRNPWDLTCHPGGSSTGSAVSVAVRSSFGAIGTDSGGSIRIPASVNGVVGLKPTFGRVSARGVFPMSPSLDHVGPIARTVEDCAILLQAMAGHDTGDDSTFDVAVPDFRRHLEDGVEGLVVGVEREHAFYPGSSPEVVAAVEAVIDDLAAQGAKIVDVRLPQLRLMGKVGLAILSADTYAGHRELLAKSAHLYDRSTRLFVESGGLMPASDYIQAQKVRVQLRAAARRTFDEHALSVLVGPTIPIPPLRFEDMGRPSPHLPDEMPLETFTHNTYFGNVTGQPGVSVPCGFSSGGMPIGVQIMGRPFDEPTLLRVARSYERLHHWAAEAPVMASNPSADGI